MYKCSKTQTLHIDNGSGTYAPKPESLHLLKEVFQANFPELKVVTHDFHEMDVIRKKLMNHEEFDYDECLIQLK
jgi:hypothetical protein